MRLPIIVNIPIPMPRVVGQSVPDCGRAGAVGVAVGFDEPVGVAVGVEPGQTQSVSLVQLGFRQKPPEQIKSLLQFEFDPQVPLQLFGVPVGVGVGVGVGVPDPVGVGVGLPDPVGVGVGVFAVNVKEREQAFSVGTHVPPAEQPSLGQLHFSPAGQAKLLIPPQGCPAAFG